MIFALPDGFASEERPSRRVADRRVDAIGVVVLDVFAKQPSQLPSYLQEYRATLLRHPAAQWAVEIYHLHRGHSAEVPKRTAAV